MSLNPNELSQLASEGKIDSRMKDAKVTHPRFNMERCYCCVCGNPKGYVSTESAEFIRVMNIIVVCDDCEASFGELPLPKADIKDIKEIKEL